MEVRSCKALPPAFAIVALPPAFAIVALPPGVRHHVLRQLRAQAGQEAEDALQEACLRYLQRPPEVKNEDALIAWLLTVARRVLLDQRRHAFAIVCVSLSEAPVVIAEDGMDIVLFRVALRQALQMLTAAERALLARRAEGRTCSEIAVEMNLTEAAVKKRWQRARQRCQEGVAVFNYLQIHILHFE